jgi:hypothetical protein
MNLSYRIFLPLNNLNEDNNAIQQFRTWLIWPGDEEAHRDGESSGNVTHKDVPRWNTNQPKGGK